MIKEYFRSKNVQNSMDIDQIEPYAYKLSFRKSDFVHFSQPYDLIYYLRGKLNYFNITQFNTSRAAVHSSNRNKRRNENELNNQENASRAKQFCFNGNETILGSNIPRS
jgi:hypothetical protein